MSTTLGVEMLMHPVYDHSPSSEEICALRDELGNIAAFEEWLRGMETKLTTFPWDMQFFDFAFVNQHLVGFTKLRLGAISRFLWLLKCRKCPPNHL